MSVGEIFKKKKTNMQDSCKICNGSQRLYFTSPTIADLAILLVSILATVEVANSTMSLTMTMTTASVFHGCDSIAGIRLGVESVLANQEMVFVESFLVEECGRILVLDKPSVHVVSLHLEKIIVNRHVTRVCRILPFRHKNVFCIDFVHLE